MTFSRLILMIYILLFFGKKIIAQDCPLPQNNKTLQGNYITANIPTGGNSFFNRNADEYFIAPNTLNSPVGTILSSGLWLGAMDENGNIKIAATKYESKTQYDYVSGPILEEDGELIFECENYDQLWEVFGFEIEQHISDFEDNGIIDQPIKNIFGYPAHQNPFFKNIHGFILPNTQQGLAPFFDRNSDGFYDPSEGDFPLPTSVNKNTIPSHIIWKVFNDAGANHSISNSDSLNVEVQQTLWSFYCDDNPILNHSIFTSYKIINRGAETLDSMNAGIFTDFDLGCWVDDNIGCAPNLNTYYSYNDDDIDGSFWNCDDMNTYENNPPVQAITFLNQTLNSFVYFNQGSGDYEIGVYPPYQSQGFFNYLNGKWRNGIPITYGSDGYNSGDDTTFYAYSGNPNDSLEWSMKNVNLPYGEYGSLGNNYIGSLPHGAIYTLDLAYSFYQDSTLNNIETVDLIYDNTPLLQQMYDSNFDQICPNNFCQDDCIWTGDANRDSIVNNYDILQIGLGFGEQGSTREAPLVWMPFKGNDWENNIDSIDLKHTDCSGDGVIDSLDFNWVKKHFYNSYKKDTIPDVFNNGPEINFTYSTISNDSSIDSLAPSDIGWAKLNLTESKKLYGIALTVDYDTTYFNSFFGLKSTPWESQIPNQYSFLEHNSDKGEYYYACVKTDGLNSLSSDDNFLRFALGVKDTELYYVETVLRVKNIKAILKDGAVLDYGAQSLLVTIRNATGNGFVTSTGNLEENNIQIFPNPTTHLLNVKLENAQVTSFDIFDVYGKKVFEKAKSFNSDFQLPIEHLSEGIYFLKIKMEDEEVVQKFIKI